jgi:Ca2+-binding RTX toxin-like protein
MSIFAFETITAAQALSIGAGDSLTIAKATGTATGVTVLYAADGTNDIDVNFVGGQTIVFGPNFAALTQTPGQLTFADGSFLYVGDANANNFNALSFSFSPSSNGAPTAAFGGAGDDNLAVNGPHDVLQGNAGNDVLSGGPGDDTIYGGQGNDSISVGAGVNFGQGNKGNDTLTGGGTTDTLLGGQGDDHITGAGFLDGNLGDDVVSGSGQLFGEGGNDTLTSIGTGNDTLSGGDGDDSLVAGQGHDSITGDAGNDTISVTGGGHTIAGGPGADKFIFGAGTTATGTVPAIIDWDGAQDTLSFLGFTPNPSDFTAVSAPNYAAAVTMATQLSTQNHFSFVGVQVGADFIIFAGGAGGLSSVVDLVGRSLADFTPSHNLV